MNEQVQSLPIKSFIRRNFYTIKIFSYRQPYLLKVPKSYILHKSRNFIFSTVLIIYLLFFIILYLLTQPRSKFSLVGLSSLESCKLHFPQFQTLLTSNFQSKL